MNAILNISLIFRLWGIKIFIQGNTIVSDLFRFQVQKGWWTSSPLQYHIDSNNIVFLKDWFAASLRNHSRYMLMPGPNSISVNGIHVSGFCSIGIQFAMPEIIQNGNLITFSCINYSFGDRLFLLFIFIIFQKFYLLNMENEVLVRKIELLICDMAVVSLAIDFYQNAIAITELLLDNVHKMQVQHQH